MMYLVDRRALLCCAGARSRITPYARMWRTESAGPSHFHA